MLDTVAGKEAKSPLATNHLARNLDMGPFWRFVCFWGGFLAESTQSLEPAAPLRGAPLCASTAPFRRSTKGVEPADPSLHSTAPEKSPPPGRKPQTTRTTRTTRTELKDGSGGMGWSCWSRTMGWCDSGLARPLGVIVDACIGLAANGLVWVAS